MKILINYIKALFLKNSKTYSIIFVHVKDLFFPTKIVNDRFFNGYKPVSYSRNIYLINDVSLINKDIYIKTKNNIILRILGINNQYRGSTYIENFSKKNELIKIPKNKKVLNVDGLFFIYLPMNPKKSNYWHLLIDNISQLLFVLNNEKISSVILYKNISILHRKYIYFLSKKFNFKVIKVLESTLDIIGKGVFSEISVKYFHKYNKIAANKRFMKAQNEINRMGLKVYDIKYKDSEFVYQYKVRNLKLRDANETYIKDFNIPYSTPISKSSIDSFNILTKKIKGKNIKRIFALRKFSNVKTNLDVKNRSIRNSEEIYQELRKFNFNFINFSDYSFEQQISLCKNANVIMGAHGANLVNLIFMKENTSLIKLTPHNYSLPKTDEYKELCRIKSIKYNEIMCGELDKNVKSKNYGTFEVNLNELKKYLKNLN